MTKIKHNMQRRLRILGILLVCGVAYIACVAMFTAFFVWVMTQTAQAAEPYAKAGVGYDHNAKHSVRQGDQTQMLYLGSDYAYQIEVGLEVPIDTQYARIGLYYYDMLQQTPASKAVHRPYKAEVFYEHNWTLLESRWFLASGYKIAEQSYIRAYGGKVHVNRVPLGKFSARCGVAKRWGNWEFEMSHDSNWLTGKPFNNQWEYWRNSLMINYYME